MLLIGLASAGCVGSRQYQAGAVYLDAQDYDRAVETLREAVKARPGNTEYLARLEAAESKSADQHVAAAQEHLRNRRLTDAHREIEIARDRVPTHPEVTRLSEPLKRQIARCDALVAQSEAALSEGRWEEAYRLATEAQAIDTAHPAAESAVRRARAALVADHIAAARLAAQRGDEQSFMAALDLARQIDPNDPVVQQMRRQAGSATADPAAVATRAAGEPASGPVVVHPADSRPFEPPAPDQPSRAGAGPEVAAGPAPQDRPPAPEVSREIKPLPGGRRASPPRPAEAAPAVVPVPPPALIEPPDHASEDRASPLIIGLGPAGTAAGPDAVRPAPRPASRPEGAPAVPLPAVAPTVAPVSPVAPAGPAVDKPPAPVRPSWPPQAEPGRIVPAPRHRDPGLQPQAFLHRAVISRKDTRYRDTATTVDGVTVRLRDTDHDPLDADIEIRIGTTRIRRDDLRIGQGVTFRVAEGRTYRLVVLSILDDRETVSFGIQRVPDAR